MFYIYEALEAYNWYCTLATSIMGNTPSSWVERSRDDSVTGNDLQLIRLISDNKSFPEYPYCKIISEFSEDEVYRPLFKIHVYIDNDTKWQDNYRSYKLPICCRYKKGVKGITTINAVVIPYDVFTLDIDPDKFESEGEMWFRLRNFYKDLFMNILSAETYQNTINRYEDFCEILADIFLITLSRFDIEKCYDYDKELLKNTYSRKSSNTFAVDASDIFVTEEKHKRKNEFLITHYSELLDYIKEFVNAIITEEDSYLNPTVKKTAYFLKLFSDLISYRTYMDFYKDKEIAKIIGPIPNPV